MTDQPRHRPFRVPPRLLSVVDAANYLAISRTTLLGLPIRRRILGGRKLYDVHDLDAYASSLPVEGEDGGRETWAADQAWGPVEGREG